MAEQKVSGVCNIETVDRGEIKMARYDDDPRVAECQREIQRLRGVVRELQDDLYQCQIVLRNAVEIVEEHLYHGDILEQLGITEQEYYDIMHADN